MAELLFQAFGVRIVDRDDGAVIEVGVKETQTLDVDKIQTVEVLDKPYKHGGLLKSIFGETVADVEINCVDSSQITFPVAYNRRHEFQKTLQEVVN